MTERRAPRAVRGRGRGQHPQPRRRWKSSSSRRRSRSSRAITALYKKFGKVQHIAPRRAGRGRRIRAAPTRSKYQKLREELTAEVESVQFHSAKIEYLVDQLYAFNRRLTALGGQMLRLAERHKVPRKDFLDRYIDHELDEGWLESVASIDKKWARLRRRNEADAVERIRSRDRRDRAGDRHVARRVPPHRQHGPEGRARGAHRQEGNGRGEPAPRDLDRQEIHQPRPAVPGSHPGRQYRPDEGGRQVRVSPRLQVQRPMRPGGSARRSPARSPTRRARSASRST